LRPALSGRGRCAPPSPLLHPFLFNCRQARLRSEIHHSAWSATIKVATLLGRAPDALTQAELESGRNALIASLRRHRPDSHGVRALTTALFGAEATLFHLGVTNVPPHKLHPNKTNLREAQWASGPSRLAATLCASYIQQVRLSLRPSTMYGIDAALRG